MLLVLGKHPNGEEYVVEGYRLSNNVDFYYFCVILRVI